MSQDVCVPYAVCGPRLFQIETEKRKRKNWKEKNKSFMKETEKEKSLGEAA